MRSLEEALIKRHKQELDKVHETIVKNGALQPDRVHLNLDASSQDSRQPHSAHLEGSGQEQQKQQKQQRNIDRALELACVAENLAHIDNIEDKRRGFLTTSLSFDEKNLESVPQMRRTSTSDAVGTETFHMHSVFKGISSPSWDTGRPSSARTSPTTCVGDEMTDRFSRYVRFFNGHPLTVRRWLYDMLAVVFTIYDVLVIPLELAELVGTSPTQEMLIAAVECRLSDGFFSRLHRVWGSGVAPLPYSLGLHEVLVLA